MKMSHRETANKHIFRRTGALVVGACLVAIAASWAWVGANARTDKLKSVVLLSSNTTVLGEKIVYPSDKPAKITAVEITMQPGQQTGWHTHSFPIYGYVLEGELTVDYGPHGKRTFKKGDSLLETIKTPHNGSNTGNGPMRLLAVLINEEGRRTSDPAIEPARAQ